MNDDRWLERLAEAAEFDTVASERAPARLKAKLYSALVTRQSESGRLLSLTACSDLLATLSVRGVSPLA
jgi:hypothetical protein